MSSGSTDSPAQTPPPADRPGRFSGVRWTRWRRLSQLAILLFFVVLPFSYAHQHQVLGNLASLQIGPVDLDRFVDGNSQQVGITAPITHDIGFTRKVGIIVSLDRPDLAFG